jgi:hypothetical protein
MVLAIEDVYSVRFGAKLPLPLGVQNNIAKLRITPAVYKPNRPFIKHSFKNKHQHSNEVKNWREAELANLVRRVKEKEDPEYSEIFSIFNKLAPSSVETLSQKTIALIQKRDEQFRLRISLLLFDKAITQSAFSALMADCAYYLNQSIPEIADDLQSQITMFPKLYNINDTIVFPTATEEGFATKVIEWMNQKEKRRGYAKFMMELYAKQLILEQSVTSALTQVCNDLADMSRQQKDQQTEENATQFAMFIFECAKKVKGDIAAQLKGFLAEFLAIPRAEMPNLNMRSRFKLEDALKELNKEEKA